MMSKTITKKTEGQGLRESVIRQLALLRTLSIDELRAKWNELYGTEAPSYKSQFMMKRLAYRIQELYFSGLPQAAKNVLSEIASGDPVASANVVLATDKPEGELLAGTRFVRFWNGVRHEVLVHEHGFEYNNKLFRSLSAIAREITGTRWNGKVFFGIKKSSVTTIEEDANE